MTKGYNNNNLAQISNLGSMLRATGANKSRQVITTSSVITNARTFFTIPIAQPTDSLYTSGTYLDLSLSTSLGEIYPSGLPNIGQNFDQFRFKNAEVFLTVDRRGLSADDTELPVLTVFSSIDFDDALPTVWEVYRTRKNIALNNTNQHRTNICLASFKPVANFAVSTGTSSPNNMVPSKNQWFDASALSQQFLGLKLHVAAQNSADARRFAIFAKIDIEWKAQV